MSQKIKVAIHFEPVTVTVDVRALAENVLDMLDSDHPAVGCVAVRTALTAWLDDSLTEREFPSYNSNPADRTEVIEAVLAELARMQAEEVAL